MELLKGKLKGKIVLTEKCECSRMTADIGTARAESVCPLRLE